MNWYRYKEKRREKRRNVDIYIYLFQLRMNHISGFRQSAQFGIRFVELIFGFLLGNWIRGVESNEVLQSLFGFCFGIDGFIQFVQLGREFSVLLVY